MAFDAIQICFGELNMRAEEHIMKAVQQVDVNVDKEKLLEAIKAKDFVDELIGYIFAYPDDDYMTMECLCRKLIKHGLIDKVDGCYEPKDEPQTDEEYINNLPWVEVGNGEQTDEPQRDCFLCKWLGDVDVCGRCRNRNLFAEADTEPKPQTESTGYNLSPVEDEPTTQTETQNSNLTFKTLEYCDICDHKGCEECIANALDEHCMPSQFKKQIEDECTKEYEELGLKELKELIEADRKTEPSNSEKPNNCEDLQDWKDRMWAEAIVTEPTISKMEQVDKDINARSTDEPQTQLTARCLNCNNAKACKEKHWEGCVYEPKDEKTCETCRHWKYIAKEWQCEACKCQGYEPKDEPQTERRE